jgi:Glutaredoxin-like domain (DUF836)
VASRILTGLRRHWSPGPISQTHARLYVQHGCHLCGEALELLRPFERSGRLALDRVDIGADPQLLRRYALAIPVLEIDGGPRLDWPFRRSDLKRLLG